jgi:antitoxin ParD1/3/4
MPEGKDNTVPNASKAARAPCRRAIAELGGLWDAGIESGPSADGEEAFARIRRKLDAKLADRPAE